MIESTNKFSKYVELPVHGYPHNYCMIMADININLHIEVENNTIGFNTVLPP